MKRLPSHVAARLSVPEDASLSPVYASKRPPDARQKGAVAALALEDIHPAHEVAEVRVAALPEGFGRVEANRRVLVFPLDAYVLLDEEVPHRVLGELLYVDTTGRDIWLACTGAEGLAVHAVDGDLDAFSVEAPSRLESLPPGAPHPSCAAPPVADWLGASPSPAWIGAVTAELAASPDPLDRVSAAGVVTRFWNAPDRASRRAALASLRAWIAPASAATLADALLVADRLLDQITTLDELDVETARTVAGLAARERDRLEGVRAVLVAAGAAGSLDPALCAVDEAARDSDLLASLLEEEPAFTEEFADTVLEREPFAWWVLS